jgi:hypothetical protein
VRAIAYEWQLPPEDVAIALKSGNRATEEMFDFANRHKISLDWLIWGDIKGLQRMMRLRRPAGPPPMELREKILSLTPHHQQIVMEEIQRMLEERQS